MGQILREKENPSAETEGIESYYLQWYYMWGSKATMVHQVNKLITDRYSVSDSVKTNKLKNTNTKNINQVRSVAERLTQKLNNPTRFKYYCKVAWKLPESVIELNLESALKGRNPKMLFSWLCEQDLKALGN